MNRDQLPPHVRPNYTMREDRVVYVAVAKAACTSIKWLIADLQGIDAHRFLKADSANVSRDMSIHLRRRWTRTPPLAYLEPQLLADIAPENGWFVFTVVRHPSARFFSAWQSKLLLREPRWAERHGHQPWFPRIPRSTEEVVEDFRRFAVAMAEAPDDPVMRDRHFMAQWREAAADRLPYTRIYDTSEIPQLLDDLARHLRAQGRDVGELRLRRSNETPLRPLAAMFGPEVREAVEALYAEDFSRFGYEDVVPDKLHPAESYPEAAFDEIARLVERHERIGDLATRVEVLDGRLAREEEARRAAEREVRELRAEIHARSWRVRASRGLRRVGVARAEDGRWRLGHPGAAR